MGIAIVIPDVDFSNANLGKVKRKDDDTLDSIEIICENSYSGVKDFTPTVSYYPEDTDQQGVLWSIVSGSHLASIEPETGTVSINPSVSGSITIRATSIVDASIYSEKTIGVNRIWHPTELSSANGEIVMFRGMQIVTMKAVSNRFAIVKNNNSARNHTFISSEVCPDNTPIALGEVGAQYTSSDPSAEPRQYELEAIASPLLIPAGCTKITFTKSIANTDFYVGMTTIGNEFNEGYTGQDSGWHNETTFSLTINSEYRDGRHHLTMNGKYGNNLTYPEDFTLDKYFGTVKLTFEY